MVILQLIDSNHLTYITTLSSIRPTATYHDIANAPTGAIDNLLSTPLASKAGKTTESGSGKDEAVISIRGKSGQRLK